MRNDLCTVHMQNSLVILHKVHTPFLYLYFTIFIGVQGFEPKNLNISCCRSLVHSVNLKTDNVFKDINFIINVFKR